MTGEFKTLLRFCETLLHTCELPQALPVVLSWVIRDTKADRGHIEIFNAHGGEPYTCTHPANDSSELLPRLRMSSKALERVRETGKTVVITNAMTEDDFVSQTTLGDHILSIACTPLLDQGRVFGVIYLDNLKEANRFDDSTGEMLRSVGAILAPSLLRSLHYTLEQQDERERWRNSVRKLQRENDDLQGYGKIIGISQALNTFRAKVEGVKNFDIHVLFIGETGSGKGLAAHHLHRLSNRSDYPFSSINCSAIPHELLASELFGHKKGAFTGAHSNKKGYIAEAKGGTLFLDEIGSLQPETQIMLLGFLDRGYYSPLGASEKIAADVRLIFATNEDLQEAVAAGRFRSDLYHRISQGVIISVPALRDRREDIPVLADFYARQANQHFHTEIRLSREVIELLSSHSFPGNVRQLQRFVTNALLNASMENSLVVERRHLPEDFFGELPHAPIIASRLAVDRCADRIYDSYQPPAYQEAPFVWGRRAADNVENGAIPPERVVHDYLMVAIRPAGKLPFATATEAMNAAFERELIMRTLNETRGAIAASAQHLGMDRKTLRDKMERYHLNKNWFKS